MFSDPCHETNKQYTSVDSIETGSAVVINDYWVWYGGPSCEEVSSDVGVEWDWYTLSHRIHVCMVYLPTNFPYKFSQM